MSSRLNGDGPRSDPNAHLSPTDLFLERRSAMRHAIRFLYEQGRTIDHTDARTLEIWLEELQALHNAAVAVTQSGGSVPC